MADNPTREEVKAQIDAVKASTETLVARLEGTIGKLEATIGGRIDSLGSKIDALQADNRETRSEIRESRRWVMGTTFAVGLALAGLMVALLIGIATHGDAMFGYGMNVRDLVQTTIKELQQAQAPPERK